MDSDQPLFPSLPQRGTSAGFSEAPGKALLGYPANCEPQQLRLQDCFCREAAAGPPGPGRWVQDPALAMAFWHGGRAREARAGQAGGPPEGAECTLV